MPTRVTATTLSMALLISSSLSGQQPDVFDRVKHGYAVSDGGVKIHYATLGTGPLVVMIHGFPDFWNTWRDSMGIYIKLYLALLADTIQR